jgi:hypothetical protein
MRSRLAARIVTAVAALLALSARADEPCQPVKPCEVPEGTVPKAIEPPAELGAEVKQLFALVSCQGAPAGLDPGVVKAYCGRKAKREERARAERAEVLAALPEPRPEKPPAVVVSPLSGGDLLAARTAFPEARNFTLTGRSPAGDPRAASLRDRARLQAFLEAVAPAASGEPAAAHPALAELLGALAAEGDEPVGLRYFRVEPGGMLHFLGAGELAGLGDQAWASCEVVFVKKGEPGRQLVVRYLQADLGDAAAPGPLAYLDARGAFAALLPGEGATAGPNHGRLRALLERRAAVVVTRRR